MLYCEKQKLDKSAFQRGAFFDSRSSGARWMAKLKLKTDEKLQGDICRLLANGVTDKDMCAAVGIAVSTFYKWLADAEKAQDKSRLNANDKILIAFSEAVMRARAKARIAATKTVLKSATRGQRTVEQYTETRTETRTRKDGTPYEVSYTVSTEKVIQHPPDFRAAIEYLKRRDGEHWSEKVQHDANIRIDIHQAYEAASDAFERLLNQQSERSGAQSMDGESIN